MARVDEGVIELSWPSGSITQQRLGATERDVDCVVREACQSVLSITGRYIDYLLLQAQASAVTGMAPCRLLASLTV